MDLWLSVPMAQLHYVQKILPTLDWAGGRIGVRFFFSSRRPHTSSKRDWSSDVCSSDLVVWQSGDTVLGVVAGGLSPAVEALVTRSEERRVGKECRSRWSPYH